MDDLEGPVYMFFALAFMAGIGWLLWYFGPRKK